ncbi:hypothetical protein AVEN_254240-1 [Araneus ventricosus]|uniref:Uncharacterized protein n=1 Tax=Araneus ventricosus TaxID=182803 RepID=A0A4Y2LY46_ARAVE|nr:hypothetical protein AVEN_254240-1 [Araneus ventricosus]
MSEEAHVRLNAPISTLIPCGSTSAQEPRSGFLQMIPCDVTACRRDYKCCSGPITEQALIDLERVESSLDFERVDRRGSSLKLHQQCELIS